MVKKTVFVLTAILWCSAFGEKGGTYVSPDHGFSIDVATAPSKMSYQLALFYLPPVDGFAPNVGVRVQVFHGSMREYDEISAGQFKQTGLDLTHHQVHRNEAVYEYNGNLRGTHMHWYSRAVKKDNRVFVVTATALQNQWKRVEDELRQSVDSFSFDD